MAVNRIFTIDGGRFRLWVCFSTCLLALMPSCVSLHRLFLNSEGHCSPAGPERWHDVDMTSLYNVKNDVNAAFSDSCSVKFRSTRLDGRVCVKQMNLKFDNLDVVLKLFDHSENIDPEKSEPNKTLNDRRALGSVEWCTSGRYLTIVMSQSGPKPSMRKVDVDLLVYEFRSYYREVSMESLPSCGSTLPMDGNQVRVTNLDPHRKVKDIFPKCSLTFEYEGHEVTRSLCLVFEPRHDINQDCRLLNYSINIYSYQSKLKEFSGRRTCEQPTPREWCSNSTKIELELHRRNTAAREDVVVFNAYVLDHYGGIKTLPQLYRPPNDSNTNHGAIVAAVVVVVIAVIIAIVVVLVYRRRRRRSDETKEEKKEPSMTHIALQLPDVTSHCENIYTE